VFYSPLEEFDQLLQKAQVLNENDSENESLNTKQIIALGLQTGWPEGRKWLIL